MPEVPIMCLTASATPAVKKDILKNMKISRAVVIQNSFNRPNLL
jgi:superfamily II DNA helicase RecQ